MGEGHDGGNASPVTRALGPEAAPEAEAVPVDAAPPAKPAATGGRRLIRNTLFLVLSQFVSTPLGIIVNAVLARKLGADDFGTIYLTSTMAGLGFLFVDWGQQATITQRLAIQPAEAGETLGTSISFKLLAVIVVSIALAGIAWALGYTRAVFIALALTIAQQTFVALQGSYTSVMRAFERLDWVSGLTIAQNLLSAAFVIPVALLGGGLAGALSSQAAGALLALMVATVLLPKLRLGKTRASRTMGKVLFHAGSGFVLYNLVLALQPYVDAVILSRLASSEAVGWYAAARRLLGFLIFPATTVGFVLYPTLSRLWHEDKARFTSLVGQTLRLVILIGVCASAGTFLYADFAIRVVYSAVGFGPAIADLKVLSAFVFLLYFTVILGSAIAASGKQMVWAAAQTLCVIVSAIGDPFLVPLCDRRYQNGGLGVCIATVVSELLMVIAAMILLRKERVIGSLGRAVIPAIVGAGAMWLVAWLLRGFLPPLGMTACVMVYAGTVVALGGVDRTHLDLIKDIVRMKRRPQSA